MNFKRKNDDKRKNDETSQRWDPPAPPVPPTPPTPPNPPSIYIGRVQMDDDDLPEDLDVQALKRLVTALESLLESIRQALASGQYEGTGKMVLRSYERHTERAKTLLPDDDVLADLIETDFDEDEKDMLTQIAFATQQLNNYLVTLLRQARRTNVQGDVEELKNMGRQMGDQIMSITKNALSRAMSGLNVDIDLDFGEEHHWDEDKNYAGANMKGNHYTDEDFAEANLMGAELVHAHFNNCDFTDADLTGADMRQAVLDNCDFTDAKMSGVNGYQAQFSNADFADANLTGINLQEASLEGSDFRDVNLTGANLQQAQMARSDLRDANMAGINAGQTDLREADLREANLKHANLGQAQLMEADLREANLRGANISQADFTGARMDDMVLPDGRTYRDGDDLAKFGAIDHDYKAKRKNTFDIPGNESLDNPDDLDTWDGANLRGQNLSAYVLDGKSLRGAVLTQANLRGMTMQGADFSEALLIGADLREANLTGANLRDAKLAGADFREANLTGVDLTGANIGGADFREANLTGATLPDGEAFNEMADLGHFGIDITRL